VIFLKIEKIKINSFGKLENKEYNLSENINLIYGKNEAGKSTLLKFIQNTFYGTSKNKKGKTFSDYDLYKPWNDGDFSGKIKYKLDSGEEYEVYREFGKKSPKIYNNKLEDISKKFNIDKTTGNEFFFEQTKVDEFTFLTSIVSMQQEVKLNKQDQNVYIQKIANLAGTGDDGVSYKKAIDKLNKKQLDEIGTDRSSGKPINISISKINKYEEEIKELEIYKEKQYNIEKEINDLKKEIEKEKNKEKYLKELKEKKDEERIENEKINFNDKILNKNEESIEKNKNEIEDLINKKEKIESNKIENKINGKIYFILIFIFCLSAIAIYVIIKNITFSMILCILAIGLLILYFINKNKVLKQNKKVLEKINKINYEFDEKISSLKNEIKILEENNSEQKNEIKKINEKINSLKNEKEKIKNKYIYKLNNEELNLLFNCIDYNEIIDNVQNLIRIKELNLNTLELNNKNIIENLENLINLEELLQIEKQNYEELKEKNDKINMAKMLIEKAYEKMKNSVTPKFTSNLSENIFEISDGKYKKVTINDDEGIIVELPNGKYVSAEKLSGGTIEQLYLSLRLSMAKEISDENMPIILDEAFAYYDDERLKNTLEFLSNKFKENQIILFTCTNREKEVLDKLNKNYKIITLE
jgi:DNA repair exonuclease SbcCD ATPase subunit